jgi:glycosyltransferase involved in cell wall biosynthesis
MIGQAQYQNTLMQEGFNRATDRVIYNCHPIPEYPIIKDNKVKVVWIANLKDWKQPDVFITLAEALRHRPAEFVMVGKDPGNEWSEELKLRIEGIDKLEYLGEQSIETVNQLLTSAHILVNTSKYEGFPNTYIQAGMHKLPVVALNVDPDDILKKNQIGFHSRTLSQLIADTDQLIRNEELRNTMGEMAQRFAIKRHSFQNIDGMIELFEK